MSKKDICTALLALPDEKLRLLEQLIAFLDSDGETDKTAVDSNVQQDAEPEADEVG